MYSTQITTHERAYTTKKWEKYRLSCKTLRPIKSCIEHNLVADYLDAHPDIADKYLKKVIGFGYYNILRIAEEESKEATK